MTIQSLILESVQMVTGVTIEQMRSRTRKRHIVDARRMSCGIMREMTNLSLSCIGEEVNLYLSSGRGDNGTVCLYIKTDGEFSITYNLYGRQRAEIVERVKRLYQPIDTSSKAWGNLWEGVNCQTITA
jgi:hypothetical protein